MHYIDSYRLLYGSGAFASWIHGIFVNDVNIVFKQVN